MIVAVVDNDYVEAQWMIRFNFVLVEMEFIRGCYDGIWYLQNLSHDEIANEVTPYTIERHIMAVIDVIQLVVDQVSFD